MAVVEKQQEEEAKEKPPLFAGMNSRRHCMPATTYPT